MRYLQALALLCLTSIAATLAGCSSSAQNSVIPVYAMGDRAPVNRLIYTVFETHWKPQLETGGLPRVPQNRYFLIRLSILNGGSSDVVIPGLAITDDNGQKYQELSDGEGVPEWLGVVRKMKPADTLTGNIVFDVPPQNYKLEITDDAQEKKAIIEIPMSFAGDAPIDLPGIPSEPPSGPQPGVARPK
jgi:hypothetical protein